MRGALTAGGDGGLELSQGREYVSHTPVTGVTGRDGRPAYLMARVKLVARPVPSDTSRLSDRMLYIRSGFTPTAFWGNKFKKI